MIPTTTATALQARVAVELRDGGQTFLTTEVAEAVQRAVEDEVVYSIIEIQIPLTGARQYAVDPGYTVVFNVACDINGDGFPEFDMPGEAIDLVYGNLIIKPQYMNLTGTLFVQVAKKWGMTDAIPEYLSNYIINSSVYYCMELLENTYADRFLNNDATMEDMINRGTEAKQEMMRLRKQLRHQKPVRI